MGASGNEQAIDTLNRESWELRYSDPQVSREKAQKALELSKNGDYSRGIAYANLNLGACHFLMSENREAHEFLHTALVFFNQHQKEEGYPDTLTLVSNIYESFGEYERAIELCQQAIHVARETGNKEGLAEAKSVLGLIFSRISDYDHALEAYGESLRVREELDNLSAVASSLNRIARIYTLKKDFGKALDLYNRSLEIRMQLNQKGVLPWTYLGLASTYEEMKDFRQAEDFYKKILSNEFTRIDDRCGLQARLGLGRTLYLSGKEEEAGDSLKKALVMANKLEAKPLQYEAHQALARYYELTGVFNLALLHYKKYRKIREDVLNEESQNRLKNQQVAYAIEKSEKEKEIFQLRNVELKNAFDEIKKKNEAITDSINYASRIQAALLPKLESLEKAFNGHFILFLPRDVVSGDFYWAAETGGKAVFAAADCTGHGVPGAFMSMLGITFLNELVLEKGISSPGTILNHLRDNVIKAMKQSGRDDEQKDGMDIALCAYDPQTMRLEFAGAYNPLYLIRQAKLEEYKPDRMPVSYYQFSNADFRTTTLQLQKGDQLYIFSDGFADQFGGPAHKKFKYKPLKELLVELSPLSMEKQKLTLLDRFTDWKGDLEQIDDVLLMGLRI